MKKSTFKLLFLIRRNQVNKDGKCAIMIKVTVDIHWAVENGLHWHLDVTFKEDDCRALRDNAAQNLSLIGKIALQVAKATDDRLSVRKRLVRATMDSDYLMLLLKNYGFH